MLRERSATSPTRHVPIRQLYLIRFDGASWQAFGDAKGGAA